MRLFSRVEDFSAGTSGLVLALGFFDGIHLGHQKILNAVKADAQKRGASAAVFTFQNHPQTLLRPDLPAPLFITSSSQKHALLERFGIEICFSVPFTEDFSQMEAEYFVREILLQKLNVKKICLGYNAHFGRGRSGNPQMMRGLASKLGFEFEEIGPVEIKGEPVSSSRIRKLVQAGDLAGARDCLGRTYSLLGTVVKGDGRGAQIGFPTANLESENQLLPPEGVYPVWVKDLQKDSLYEGVLNYGRRPTFKEGQTKLVLEAHLLDFMGNLYGKTLEVFLGQSLRGERAFKGIPELQLQITKDIEAARRYFAQAKPAF